MRSSSRLGTIGLLLLLTSAPALAVVPGLVGPIATLLALLPQILAFVLGALGLRTRKLLPILGVVAILGTLWWMRGPDQLRGHVPVSKIPSWNAFRGSLEGGTGTLDEVPLAGPLQPLWRHTETQGRYYMASPVALAGRVYAGSVTLDTSGTHGSLDCLDATNGTLLWRQPTKYPVFSSPVLSNGCLYCGEGEHQNEDASLYCLDAATGDVRYKVPTFGHLEASPSLAGDRLVFSCGGDGLRCVDPKDGMPLWHADIGHCDSSAAIAEERIYIGTAYGTDAVLCLDLKTGHQLWRTPVDLPAWGDPMVSAGRAYFGLGNGTFDHSDPTNPRGAALCVEAASGKQLWRRDLGDSVNTALTPGTPDSLLLGSRDGFVYCLSRADGSVRWQAQCGLPVVSSLIVQGETVIVAGGDGSLHGLDLVSGASKWELKCSSRGFDSSPMLSGGRLYVGLDISLLCFGK